MTVRLVSATRMGESDFWRHSYLGRSLKALPPALRPEELMIRYDNHGDAALGLASVYNSAIATAADDTIVLCVHDDVYLHDPFICQQLVIGLSCYRVLGLAGSRCSDLAQPSWLIESTLDTLTPVGWQRGPSLVISGAVSHAKPTHSPAPPPVDLTVFGPCPEPVDLLDGLLLAARAGDLRAAGVSFDPRFRFHLYDLDFCRRATRQGLTLGTWPTLVTHASGGSFGSTDWRAAARLYLDKWSAIEQSEQLFGRAASRSPLD